MADNITAPATGALLATDECVINSVTVQVPRVKVTWGADGTAVDVSATNPMPVSLTGTVAVTNAAGATAANQTTMLGYVDGIEGLVTATNALLTAQNGYLDGVETLITATNTALGTVNTALTTQNGYLDGVESKLDAQTALLSDTTTPAPITATQLPSTIGRKASSNSLSVTFASDIDSENHLGGVTGYSAVVPASITRPADTAPYVSTDLVANSTVAGSVTPIVLPVARVNDGTGSIRRVRLSTTKTGTAGTEIFRIHFFKNSPTVANGDNGTFSANGVAALHMGYVDVTLDRVFSDGAKGIGVPASGGEITFDPATGTKNIYALIEARSSYAPISGEVFTVALELFRD